MTFDPYHEWLGIPPGEQPPHSMKNLLFAFVVLSVFLAGTEWLTRSARARAHIKVRGGSIRHEVFKSCVVRIRWNDCHVSDSELIYVLRAFPQEGVDLRNNPEITDAGLSVLSKLSPQLEYIYLDGTSVTESGVREFLRDHSSCETTPEALIME